MVSMVEVAFSKIDNETATDLVVPKREPAPDGSGSMSSSASTPEPEGETLTQDVTQTQKRRKGGRKPIYATSEERKQRNRQAQAAFRERRTEYIKQLETTIKRNEETLQSLQQSHRTAADECLMLRYKNSLLEKVLLEKGIDVQAELRLKTPATAAPGIVALKPGTLAPKQPPASLERPAPSRNPIQRPGIGIAPKLEVSGLPPPPQRDGVYHVHSPQLQPTPPSHVSSPTNSRSPGFALQGAISPEGGDFQAQQPQQHARPPLLSQPRAFTQAPPMAMAEAMDTSPTQSLMPRSAMAARLSSTFYPFQKHYDQLEQEYDAQADMMDDDHHEEGVVESGSYVPGFQHPPTTGQQRIGLSGPPVINPHSGEIDPSPYGGTNPLFGHFEPMLDPDPFGLSASMHFRTPFSYEQNHVRQ
jgi:hypothetical protein